MFKHKTSGHHDFVHVLNDNNSTMLCSPSADEENKMRRGEQLMPSAKFFKLRLQLNFQLQQYLTFNRHQLKR